MTQPHIYVNRPKDIGESCSNSTDVFILNDKTSEIFMPNNY